MATNRRNFIKKTGFLATASAFSTNILLSATKAKKELMWESTTTLSQLIKILVREDFKKIQFEAPNK